MLHFLPLFQNVVHNGLADTARACYGEVIDSFSSLMEDCHVQPTHSRLEITGSAQQKEVSKSPTVCELAESTSTARCSAYEKV